jgi:nitrogen regulatory protein PII
MKKIEAYIQPFMLHKVESALRALSIRGLSIMEIKGLGREKDESYPHHEMDYRVDTVPKMKLEILCSDEEYGKITDTIKKHAHTGRRGDGKVVVYNIQELHSIRTGETGEQAI